MRAKSAIAACRWIVISFSKRGAESAAPENAPRSPPAQKLRLLTEYEDACLTRGGGAYLRREGLHSSQVSEWRRLRDAGVLDGKQPGDRIGRPTPEQAEIARLRRSLDKANQKLARTEVALEIMGKARELLEDLSSSSQPKNKDTNS